MPIRYKLATQAVSYGPNRTVLEHIVIINLPFESACRLDAKLIVFKSLGCNNSEKNEEKFI